MFRPIHGASFRTSTRCHQDHRCLHCWQRAVCVPCSAVKPQLIYRFPGLVSTDDTRTVSCRGCLYHAVASSASFTKYAANPWFHNIMVRGLVEDIVVKTSSGTIHVAPFCISGNRQLLYSTVRPILGLCSTCRWTFPLPHGLFRGCWRCWHISRRRWRSLPPATGMPAWQPQPCSRLQVRLGPTRILVGVLRRLNTRILVFVLRRLRTRILVFVLRRLRRRILVFVLRRLKTKILVFVLRRLVMQIACEAGPTRIFAVAAVACSLQVRSR